MRIHFPIFINTIKEIFGKDVKQFLLEFMNKIKLKKKKSFLYWFHIITVLLLCLKLFILIKKKKKKGEEIAKLLLLHGRLSLTSLLTYVEGNIS